MNTLRTTLTCIYHAPLYTRTALLLSIVAIALYCYALVSSVLYTSLHEEALADMRNTEHHVASLEFAYLQHTHALNVADAAHFALVPATEIAHVSSAQHTKITLRN
jgi:hypothetical protein